MAADLVGRKVDVIFVSGVAAVLAAKTRDLDDPDHFLLLVTGFSEQPSTASSSPASHAR